MPEVSKFENKNGNLKRYAFMCGYVQTRDDTTQRLALRLSHNGNNYDVQAWDLRCGYRRIFWFSTYSLKIARKIFNAKNFMEAYESLSSNQKHTSGMTVYQN